MFSNQTKAPYLEYGAQRPLLDLLVEVVGIEPTTLWLQARCSPELSYTPTFIACVGPLGTCPRLQRMYGSLLRLLLVHALNHALQSHPPSDDYLILRKVTVIWSGLPPPPACHPASKATATNFFISCLCVMIILLHVDSTTSPLCCRYDI